MLGHLRNVSHLLRAQRSCSHNNCRIGGLMFDNQHSWDLANEILHLFKHLSLEKILLVDKSVNHINPS